MRIYLDEDVTTRLVLPLRSFGHDVVDTAAVGLKGQSDPEQLAYARNHRRVIVTSNFGDFSLLHEAWSYCASDQPGRSRFGHAGIAVVPNSSTMSDTRLVEILQAFTEQTSDPDDKLFRWRSSDGWHNVLFPRKHR